VHTAKGNLGEEKEEAYSLAVKQVEYNQVNNISCKILIEIKQQYSRIKILQRIKSKHLSESNTLKLDLAMFKRQLRFLRRAK